jgi:hypothetical protein
MSRRRGRGARRRAGGRHQPAGIGVVVSRADGRHEPALRNKPPCRLHPRRCQDRVRASRSSRLRRSLRARRRSANLDPRPRPRPFATMTFWWAARPPKGRAAHQRVMVANCRADGAQSPQGDRLRSPAGPKRGGSASSWPWAVACDRPDVTARRRPGPAHAAFRRQGLHRLPSFPHRNCRNSGGAWLYFPRQLR